METRDIYFIRHGQTDANLPDGVAQANESVLNETGKEQARLVAERLKKVSFDLVITSELVRAKETGGMIANLSDINNVEHWSDFNERLKPSKLIGVSQQSSEYLQYLDDMKTRASDANWHPEDGENLQEIINRIEVALSKITNNTSGNVVVVCHGYLMRLIIAFILTQSKNPDIYIQALENIRFLNTGITHVKLIKEHWQIATVNDSTHLS